MKSQIMSLSLFLVWIVCAAGFRPPSANAAADQQFDPLKQITKTFPGTIEFKEKRTVLEFCPDNTCHGFQVSPTVSRSDLKNFAYLYIYFFSDYYDLGEWRQTPAAKETAERILSDAEYRTCKSEDNFSSAKCVLQKLAGNGRIKLLFIRYDENKRNVVHEDLAQELAKASQSK